MHHAVWAIGALSTDPDVYVYPPETEKVASQLLCLWRSGSVERV